MANKTEKEKKEPEIIAENDEVNASAEEVEQITPLQSAAEQKVDNEAKTPEVQKVTAPETVVADTSIVDAATQKLDSQAQNYNNQWQILRDDTLNKLQNRDPFTYDLNGDILYQQYADIYGRNADKAMKDTVGKVSALSGGYGNSYAQTAGQQAYSETMSGLNDIVPELYQLAQSKYDKEGQDLKDMLSLYQGLDESEYSRYRDTVSDEQWQTQFDYGVDSDQKNLALTMLSYGIVPGKELLAKAGISAEQAKMMADSVVTDKDKFDYQEKTDLRNYVMSLLSSGVSVDDDTLKKAGVSKSEANGVIKAAQAAQASSSYSSSSSSSSKKMSVDDVITLNSFVEDTFNNNSYDNALRKIFDYGILLGLTEEQIMNIALQYEPESFWGIPILDWLENSIK